MLHPLRSVTDRSELLHDMFHGPILRTVLFFCKLPQRDVCEWWPRHCTTARKKCSFAVVRATLDVGRHGRARHSRPLRSAVYSTARPRHLAWHHVAGPGPAGGRARQHITAQHSMPQATSRHDVAQDDIAGHSVTQRSPQGMTQHVVARHASAQHSAARHGTPRHATPRHATPRHGPERHGTARHGTARHGTAQHRGRHGTGDSMVVGHGQHTPLKFESDN